MILKAFKPLARLSSHFVPAKRWATFCNIKITSDEAFQKFEKAIFTNTEQSLEEGAQLLAELEFEVEQNEQTIRELGLGLQNCSQETHTLIEKIQRIQDNIELTETEIQEIEVRAQKEIADCKSYSVSKIAKELLEVADSLQRCEKHSLEEHPPGHPTVEAIQRANNEIKAIFEVYGIKEFDPLGENFDPNTQEALVTTPVVEGKKANSVAYTMRSGYTIKGRLLRSAHVAIYSQ